PNSICVSATEGWRGEIIHTALTDQNGQLEWYKIKDPSMHNWKALELSLRNIEISDFPINNKSYDLSYSGHDL
ncbi:MAG: hydrogenase, partial [Flavobacteriales bacterium CG_4_8_14_3_um_filter_35_10]